MKNKLMVFLCIFLIPFIVKANSVYVFCDNDVAKTSTLSCALKGKTDKVIIAVSAKVKVGNNITFSSFSNSSIWQGDGEGGSIDLYTSEDVIGDFDIGEINLDINSVREGTNSSMTIDSIFFYDDEGNEFSIEPIKKNIRIASTINDLANLTLSEVKLNPSFRSDVTNYSATVDASSITINADAANVNSKISGDIGKVNLKYGNNTFRVVVTSESGSSKTYTVNVVRPNRIMNNNNQTLNKSNNTYLSNITLSDGNINFDKNITTYDTSVSYDITSIEVEASAEDSKSKVEIIGNNDLQVGSNKVEIRVIAEDNSIRIYTINVERKAENNKLSNNSNISNILINGYQLNFDKNKYEYDLKIRGEKKLDIKVVLEHSEATYSIIGNDNLKNNSVIVITSKAEDNSSKEYKINIKLNDNRLIIFLIVAILIVIIIRIVRVILNYRSGLNGKNK